jgi:hypothetical protein
MWVNQSLGSGGRFSSRHCLVAPHRRPRVRVIANL